MLTTSAHPLVTPSLGDGYSPNIRIDPLAAHAATWLIINIVLMLTTSAHPLVTPSLGDGHSPNIRIDPLAAHAATWLIINTKNGYLLS